MPKNIIYLLLFTLLNSCEKTIPDCSNFKRGTFKYTAAKFAEYVVTRNDSVQTERSSSTGIKMEARIRWTSNCEYEMIYKKTNYLQYQTLIGHKVSVKITKVKNNTMYYDAESDGKVISSSMTKINP
jgi:hypothetical protein